MGILAKYIAALDQYRSKSFRDPRSVIHDVIQELAINHNYLTDQSIIDKFNNGINVFDRTDLIKIANAIALQGGKINTDQSDNFILVNIAIEIERLSL